MTTAQLEVDGELAARPGGSPLWLRIGAEPVYGVLHAPTGWNARSTAVLIVPPFGWDDACSYRPRRDWAVALAEHGFVTLRIDLPGTGDSAGQADAPARAESWVHAIEAAAAWLRGLCDSERVAAIGIGLGGLLTVQAAAQRAQLDELVLWAVPSRGREAVRAMRVYAAMIAGELGDEHALAPRKGVIDLAGYALGDDSAAALAQIDLTALDLRGAGIRRALLIERGVGGVDEKLQAHLAGAGIHVTVAPGVDYDALLAPPQEAAHPGATIERTLSWLSDGDVSKIEPRAPDPRAEISSSIATDSVEFEFEGVRLRETLFAYEADGGRAVGVLTEPATPDGQSRPLTIVLPNAGSLRRVGPCRLWTDVARLAAARGCAAVRADFPGLGDADGDPLRLIEDAAHYTEPMILAEQDLLDRLVRHGLAPRFMLVGLCSSSYWGWHIALRDDRVAAAVLINLYAFLYSHELVLERDRRRTIAVMRSGLLERLRRKGLPRSELRRAVRSVVARLRNPSSGGSPLEHAQLGAAIDAFDLLGRRGAKILFLFSQGEGLLEQLDHDGLAAELAKWPNIAVERLPTRDHVMRVSAVRELVAARLVHAVDDFRAPGS